MYKQRPLRPVKFNIGMGIGKALEVGGQFYNDMAVELRNQQALEEARAFQTSEREASQKFTQEMEDQRNQFTIEREDIRRQQQLDDLDRSEAREDNQRFEDRNQELADLQSGMDHDLALRDLDAQDIDRVEPIPFKDLSPDVQQEFADSRGITEEQLAELRESDQPFSAGVDSRGRMKALGADPNFVQLSDGTWTQRSSVTDASSLKESEGQATLRLAALDSSMNRLVQSLDSGFDPRSLEAGWNRFSRNLPMGNWVTTELGQQFTTTRNTAGEALFKSFSGAAGSDAEAERYYTMLPTEGDFPNVVQMKLEMVAEISDALQLVANMADSGRMQDGWKRQILLDEAARIATANNFDIETGQFIDPNTGAPDVPLDDNALQYLENTNVPTALNTQQLMNNRNSFGRG